MATQIVHRGFVVRPLLEALNLDADVPTIEAVNCGEQTVTAADALRWFSEEWPAAFELLKGEFFERERQHKKALDLEANAAKTAARQARKTAAAKKAPTPRGGRAVRAGSTRKPSTP